MGNKFLENKGLHKLRYDELGNKQKESYNFHKVTAKLADYGFSCYPLKNDWQNADFVAYDLNSNTRLFVQQKARLTIDKKYQGKELIICFPLLPNTEKWVFIPHDELISLLKDLKAPYFSTSSWQTNGNYHTDCPNENIIKGLQPYILD